MYFKREATVVWAVPSSQITFIAVRSSWSNEFITKDLGLISVATQNTGLQKLRIFCLIYIFLKINFEIHMLFIGLGEGLW